MILAESGIDFKRYEREIFKKVCELGRYLIKNQLWQWDAEIMAKRDKEKYRHKGLRKSTIKTVMGEVEHHRAIYAYKADDGRIEHVYLLDEAMGESGSGAISALLAEQVVQASCAGSYREAARTVSELTGQKISHTLAWQVVQELGGQVGEQEKAAAALAAKGQGRGKLEAKLLFEEQDGIWLNLQGKSRKGHGKSGEMKLGIAYDGAEKAGKDRYRLTNKVACASFDAAGDFQKRKEGAIAGAYNVDEIGMRFLNGDGASWIKKGKLDETVHFQLDPYHRNQAVLQNVSDPEARKRIMGLLYGKDTDLLLTVIEAYANSTMYEKERENYLRLHTYFKNNKDGLVPCHRRGLDMPEPPDGKEYRRLGAMESNIFTIVGNRMKGGRACWSIEGADNLARLLCLKFTGKLSETLDKLAKMVLPERYAEEIEVAMSAAKSPARDGKGRDGGIHRASVPGSMQWLKGLAALKPLHEM